MGRLQMQRERAMLTRARVSDMVGVSCTTVQNWETGRTSVSAVYVPVLARLYKVSIEDVVLASCDAVSGWGK